MKSQAIYLASRPEGEPTQENFRLDSYELPELLRGQVLVENQCFTVDPYMRGRMNEGESYVPPFEVGKPLDGGTVGRVMKSESEDFEEGDLVVSDSGGWRTHAVLEGAQLRAADTDVFEPSDYLGAAGMPGLTAYSGLFALGAPKAGDTVMVSAASGAVGSLVCQFAKLNGCHVYGSAGSDEKVAYLTDELKIDGAFNYKSDKPIAKQFQELCPDGLDIYWDNVGDEFLEAAIESMKEHGRIVSCGMIAIYNAETPPPGPRNLFRIIQKRLQIKGQLVRDHSSMMPEYLDRLAEWKKNGEVTWETTRFQGIEKAVDAFLGLFSGENKGKMIVDLI